MALIATQQLSVASGAAPTFAAAAAGDTAKVDGRSFLVVKNANATALTLTLVTPATLATGDAYPDKQYASISQNQERWIPLITDFADPSTGEVSITYSLTASVTRAVVRV
jgi:hypothetical protein